MKYKLNPALGATISGIVLLSACNNQKEQASQPNILIIQCDQLTQRVIGAYGSKNSQTPTIDKIASNGVRFTNSYTGCPLCQPSRASILTGMMPHQINVRSNDGLLSEPEVPDSVSTIGSIFNEAGYDAVHFGKTHDKGGLRGFRHVKSEEFEFEDPYFPLNYDSYEDVNTCKNAVEYLSNPPEKPFICLVDFNNPHNICGFVGENEGIHQDKPVPFELPLLPDNFETNDLQNRPLPIQYLCCSHRRLRMATQWNEQNYRHYLAAYNYYTRMVDKNIEQVLNALYSTKAGKNTVIVLLADHGDGMTSHRIVTKQVAFYEEITRVPFIFSGKGIVPRKQNAEYLVSTTTDLMPTLCGIARIDIPSDRFGIDLTPILKGKELIKEHPYVASEWYSEWGYTISPGRMIRSKDYKYTKYLEGDGEELYNLSNDPGEKTNLASFPEYKTILKEHQQMLDQYLEKTNDNFFSLEVKVEPQWRSHAIGYKNHEGLCAPEM